MKKKTFTLVELIITIAIIAVLAVTAFLMLTKWFSKSRDSRRLADINIINKAINLGTQNTYPHPENYVVIKTGNQIAGYQGFIGEDIMEMLDISGKMLDPISKEFYGYMVDGRKKTYQIFAFMENYIDNAIGYQDYAVGYHRPSVENVYAVGDEVGFILDNHTTNGVQPLNKSMTGTIVSIDTLTGDNYICYVNSGLILYGNDVLRCPFVMSGYSSGVVMSDCAAKIYSGYVLTSMSHGENKSFTQTGATSNGYYTYTLQAMCDNGNISYAGEGISGVTCNTGYVEGTGMTCIQDICGSSIGDANGVSTATSQSAGQNWHYSATAGVCTRGCNTNYTWNGSACVANTIAGQTCTGLIANASWNTVGSITQTWNGSTWTPTTIGTYNITASTIDCRFKCNTNYTWNGSVCVANTQTASCGGGIVANASATTAGTYTQTWNGSAWAPTYSRTYGAGTCGYGCNSNYSWNGSSCYYYPPCSNQGEDYYSDIVYNYPTVFHIDNCDGNPGARYTCGAYENRDCTDVGEFRNVAFVSNFMNRRNIGCRLNNGGTCY